jgi:hypothetical protein
MLINWLVFGMCKILIYLAKIFKIKLILLTSATLSALNLNSLSLMSWKRPSSPNLLAN